MRVEIADSKPAEERNEKLSHRMAAAVRAPRVAVGSRPRTSRAAAYPRDVDAGAAVRAWIKGYSAAWKARDADAVAAMYAEQAVYRSLPFRDPLHGRAGVLDYTRWAFSSEEDADFWFGEPVSEGDRAAVEYWAVILARGGAISTLAGTVLLRFDEDGRVLEHRDYWALEEGRKTPYDGWSSSS